VAFTSWPAARSGLRPASNPGDDFGRSRLPGLVRQLKAATERDLSVGGADLAGQALAAGLVDELQLIGVPVLVGGGKRALPDGVRADLELLDTRRFAGGAVYLRYRILNS
jgi:dihydrofolate reductase